MTRAAADGHSLHGNRLQVDYAEHSVLTEEIAADEYTRNKLIIYGVPDGVDEEHCQLYLEKCFDTDVFSVDPSGGRWIVTFKEDRQLEGCLSLYTPDEYTILCVSCMVGLESVLSSVFAGNFRPEGTMLFI